MTVEHAGRDADWLNRFPAMGDVAQISDNRPFAHDEGAYDDQYAIEALDESGLGIATLLRAHGCDLGGPALELGCGTGKASIGLCRSGAFPLYLLTDSSMAFIDITRAKLLRSGVDLGAVRFAVLSDGDLGRLPAASVSAVVLRSVLHHFLDVPAWIREAARVLRPGGTIIFEEPCSPGYILMGVVAQAVANDRKARLSRKQREQAAYLAETMKAYHRRDVDKTTWEDKHLFRPDEMMTWAAAAGLTSTYIPNGRFESYAHSATPELPPVNFEIFFENYLNFCMGYGPESAAAITAQARPLCAYLEAACSGTQEPALLGIFLLTKPRDG
jgi:ubiquinone/menaquinone biosynthesis C-methylase UbiE